MQTYQLEVSKWEAFQLIKHLTLGCLECAGSALLSPLSSLTCQRHQTQRAQICLSLENAGKTSLMATGVYQAPSLGSASKSNFSLVGQTGLYFIMWSFNFYLQMSEANCLIVSRLTCQMGGCRMGNSLLELQWTSDPELEQRFFLSARNDNSNSLVELNCNHFV